MSKSIEELEQEIANLKYENNELRDICRLEKSISEKQKEKKYLEEKYNEFSSLYKAYSIDVEDLQSKITSLRGEINIVQSVTKSKKNLPPDINIDDILKDISNTNSQIDNLFEKVKKIIEFRQNQMKNISDEIEGVQNQ